MTKLELIKDLRDSEYALGMYSSGYAFNMEAEKLESPLLVDSPRIKKAREQVKQMMEEIKSGKRLK